MLGAVQQTFELLAPPSGKSPLTTQRKFYDARTTVVPAPCSARDEKPSVKLRNVHLPTSPLSATPPARLNLGSGRVCSTIFRRTSFRLSSFFAVVRSQYASPLTLVSVTFHSIFALLLPLGLWTLTSSFSSASDGPANRVPILVHHMGGFKEGAQHSRFSRSQRQFIHPSRVIAFGKISLLNLLGPPPSSSPVHQYSPHLCTSAPWLIRDVESALLLQTLEDGVRQAAPASLQIGQQFESTHEILARTLRWRVSPKHIRLGWCPYCLVRPRLSCAGHHKPRTTSCTVVSLSYTIETHQM